MKTIISCLSMFLYINAVHTQTITTFTLSELEHISRFTSSDFDTYVLNQGYHYWSEFSNKDVDQYLSDIARSNGWKDQINRAKTTGTVNFSTTDKKYYLDFKESLTGNRYRFDKEVPEIFSGIECVEYCYSKPGYSVVIYSYTVKNTPMYCVQVTKS